ncbi:MAG: zinc-dependent metalloprotease [Candidatus Nanopelagicales bacterium]
MALDVVDWDLALSTGGRLAPKGPDLELADAREAVLQMRSLADQAVLPVRECTGLVTPSDAPRAAVIDRQAWIESNIDAFRYVLAPILSRLRETAGSGAVNQVGARLTAVQLGGVLAWLSGKVLGQYEALTPPGSTPRLMLLAPNIVRVAETLKVDQRDFQMWVCLHEETHRVQFTAVPWLSNHFAGEVQALVAGSDVPTSELLKRTRDILGALVAVLRGQDGATALLRAVQTPAQREIFDRLSALMTLLEGHADVVMDDVGPEIVPSVEVIRSRFNTRRKDPGTMDSIARRVLGMDAKMRQYAEGAVFVRGVIAEVGMPGFNRIWESPAALPSLAEIAAPTEWVARVHG